MSQQTLDQLARLKGIETEYVDAWGKPAQVHPASEEKILKAMGYQLSDDKQLQRQLNTEEAEYWQNGLDPVYVVESDSEIFISVRVPIEQANQSHGWKIDLEQGGSLSGNVSPIDGDLEHAVCIDEQEYQQYRLRLVQQPLELGYHYLSLSVGEIDVASARLIVTPSRCFKQQPIAEGQKVWGLSVQLYCLRSENNWGIGDFSDLKTLIKMAAKWGADFVGLNPIHALYPAMPDSCSPYSPSSRRWINTLYIDPRCVDGFERCAAAQELVASDNFQQTLRHARAEEYVDYCAVAHIKYPLLRALFEQFYEEAWITGSEPAKQLERFIADGGESLQQIATYDAIHSQLYEQGINGWGWPVWPEHLNEFHKPGVIEFQQQHEKDILFYCYLQWLAAEQLEYAQQFAVDSGMTIGIYRDLAVGVSAGSAEIWANRDLYAVQASIGAPPDVLGPLGQNWGLPPIDPSRLYQQAYQPIIELFRSNMRSCGALRLDHVMALLRLWWVPEGDSADMGAYVYYPVEDLLAILALESQRNKCLIIGEDLGTVPEGIRELLHAKGIHSYRVFFFEQAEDGGFFSPAHYPEQAMATLTTHDMPTLKGYWEVDDLSLGKSVGLYPDQDVLQRLYQDRHHAKQQILNSLHGHCSIDDSISRDVDQVEMTEALNFGLQKHMAAGSSSLLSLQLEDWLQMDKPVNIPGTYEEYPNWRRKLTHNLESLVNESDFALSLAELAQQLSSARNKASQ